MLTLKKVDESILLENLDGSEEYRPTLALRSGTAKSLRSTRRALSDDVDKKIVESSQGDAPLLLVVEQSSRVSLPN